ncbi:hypothetical protein G6F57_018782 [Rhizopus arrhizus]|nr:hypothetical protein G6F57_018782 [Rhizopus arrhizus]
MAGVCGRCGLVLGWHWIERGGTDRSGQLDAWRREHGGQLFHEPVNAALRELACRGPDLRVVICLPVFQRRRLYGIAAGDAQPGRAAGGRLCNGEGGLMLQIVRNRVARQRLVGERPQAGVCADDLRVLGKRIRMCDEVLGQMAAQQCGDFVDGRAGH